MNNDLPDYRSEFAQYLYDETHPFGDLSPAVGIANGVLIILAGFVIGFLCAYLFTA